jgi:uncharacterized protein
VQTPIGRTLRGPTLWTTLLAAAAAAGADYALIGTGQYASWELYSLAALATVPSVAAAIYLGDREAFGFRLSPIQGWAWWAKASIVLGGIVLLASLAAAAVILGLLRYPIPPNRFHIHASADLWWFFWWMCIRAPIVEEVIYRLAICPPVTAWLGPNAAIAISGLLFAAGHVLSGNASPDNLLAGFLLAWAYLKSGTLVVPLALHSLGNLFAFAVQAAHFYWFG